MKRSNFRQVLDCAVLRRFGSGRRVTKAPEDGAVHDADAL